MYSLIKIKRKEKQSQMQCSSRVVTIIAKFDEDLYFKLFYNTIKLNVIYEWIFQIKRSSSERFHILQNK